MGYSIASRNKPGDTKNVYVGEGAHSGILDRE